MKVANTPAKRRQQRENALRVLSADPENSLARELLRQIDELDSSSQGGVRWIHVGGLDWTPFDNPRRITRGFDRGSEVVVITRKQTHTMTNKDIYEVHIQGQLEELDDREIDVVRRKAAHLYFGKYKISS